MIRVEHLRFGYRSGADLLLLDDFVGGYRIVGTTPAYIELHDGTFASGHVWRDPI